MTNYTVQCEHCGATCNLKDGYCKNCWKKLPCDNEQSDFIIDGIGQSEWEKFIDKNADRYIDVYKKNEGRKWFLHINWAAMCFGINWMFYRKMNKRAFAVFFLFAAISMVLQIVLAIPYLNDMSDLTKDIVIYEEYVASGKPTVMRDYYGNLYSPEVVERYEEAIEKKSEIELKFMLNALWMIPIQCGALGLFGDAIYKSHIMKNIKTGSGGTSVVNLLGMRILLNIVTTVIEIIFVLLISSILTWVLNLK